MVRNLMLDIFIYLAMCFIFSKTGNTKESDAKSDERVFLRYSVRNKAYRVYNKRLKKIIESINVVVQMKQLKRLLMVKRNV